MFDMLQDEVAELRSENASLKAAISRLNQRVTFFSFFYLQEVNTTATTQIAGESSVSTLLGGTSAPHTTGTKIFADVITDSIVIISGQPLIIDSSTVGGPLTSDVVYKPTTLLNKTIQGAELSAVHDEMLSKEARRCNIIISGLPLKSGTSDIVLMDDLIEVEYGFRPKISRTRRLGKIIYNRNQPIAVTLVDVADAAYLLEHAKQLRESVDDNVCRMVFFNRNMTKAIAQVAYELRVQRR